MTGNKFLSNVPGGAMTEVTESLVGKIIFLYFGAHWCGPCRAFNTQLLNYYSLVKTTGNMNFQVIFCSSDNNEASFEKYYG